MWFKKILVIFFLFPFIAFAQNTNESIENQALSEAQAMDITTQQQALDALKKRGIDENQARQIAKMRGIDFDQFLRSNFKTMGDSLLKKSSSNVFADPPLKVTPTLMQLGEIQEKNPISISKSDIDKHFGYDIFINNPFAQKEYLVGNIDEGYIIAPGDVLRILVFGDNAMQIEAKVDMNGNISIPNFGVFMASGSNFNTLRNRLKIYLGKYFSGLLSSPQRTFLDVSLTQIRPTSITVLGEAITPGPHLVSGFATVLNAIYAAGGIKIAGSLRSIKVFRNNQLLKEVDLYDYITSGKLDNDIRLANNDIIFIAPRISSISLSGAVKKAMIYELKKNEGLIDLVRFSGGLLPTTSISDVVIQRITPFENRDQKRVYDRFLTSVNYGQLLKQKVNFPIENGDSVNFNFILEKTLNNVKLYGNINQYGSFPLDKYSDLKSLIKIAGRDVKLNTYMGKVDVFKEDMIGDKSFITYNLSSILNDLTKVNLENDDSVYVYSLKEVAGINVVKISGFLSDSTFLKDSSYLNSDINKSTTSKSIFWRKNLSIFDLIFQSTSFEELSYQSKLLSSRIDLKRFDPVSGLFILKHFSLDNLDQVKNTFLQPLDEIILFSKGIYEVVQKNVKVVGLVNRPSKLLLNKEMYVEDAILLSGGFKEYADQESVIVNREKFDINTGKLSDNFDVLIDLDYLKGLKQNSSNKFILQKNDIVIIRKMKGVEKRRVVNVAGEVEFPSDVILEKEINSFTDIIKLVGGLKTTSNLNASYIIRNNKILSLNLNDLLISKREVLEDGDSIYVATDRGLVSTLGALQNESQFIWKEGQKAKYYIKLSGGKIRKEAEESYLILPNGGSYKISLFRNPKVLPNSKIVVNRKLPKKDQNGDKAFDKFLKFLTIVTSTLTAAVLASKL